MEGVGVRTQRHLTSRSSCPWVIVGRVWPRHGHRGRPLNSIVRAQIDMDTLPQGFWGRMLWVALGAAVGVVCVLIIRVQVYEAAGLRPNMAPQIAYLLSPILIGAVLSVAAFLEAGLTKWWFPLRRRLDNMAIGLSYATFLLPLISHGAAWLFIATNPIVVRWILRKVGSHEPSAL